MRDIVATIQRDQDEAIRAPSRGVTEITGGPGTGKTVVALHRAAYLLYSERRRFENGGILVVGPSAAYTAYIERVLPSLGEESVALRALGDLVDGMTATRLDPPEVAAIKGSLRIRRLLSRMASRPPAGAPTTFRAFVGGHAVRLDDHALRRIRSDVLRGHQHNLATDAARSALAEAAWRSVRQGERDAFLDAFDASRDVDEFMASWWRQLDARELLLGLADTDHVYAVSRGVLDHEEGAAVAYSTGRPSSSAPGRCRTRRSSTTSSPGSGRCRTPTGRTSVSTTSRSSTTSRRGGSWTCEPAWTAGWSRTRRWGSSPRPTRGSGSWPGGSTVRPATPTCSSTRHRTCPRCSGGCSRAADGRRRGPSSVTPRSPHGRTSRRPAGRATRPSPGRSAGRSTCPRTTATRARSSTTPVTSSCPWCRMPTSRRRCERPGSTRSTAWSTARWWSQPRNAVDQLLGEVEGSIAVITARRWHERMAGLDGSGDGRVQVIDPLSAKGLEWDATVVVDPDAIAEESPGGVRVLYVVLTRAAHRMHVLRPA